MSRRQRLWSALPSAIDWVILADPRHINYLCGFWVDPLSNSGGERGFLFLERQGGSVLMCDASTLSSAIGEPYVDRKIVERWYGAAHEVTNRDHVLFAALNRFASAHRGGQGMVEEEWFPLGAREALGPLTLWRPTTITSLGSLLRGLRRRKEPDEIELLNRCFRAGEAGHRRAREIVAAGISEIEVYREVQSAAIGELGALGLVYGDFRSTSPEHPNAGGPPTDHVLQTGETFILDFSVVFAGYRGDFTNSFAIGPTTDGQRELMDACRVALTAGERALYPGATGASIHHAVDAPLSAAGWPLMSHAGHGLGLSHPEAPAFLPNSDETLVEGDVVTLEPGAYVQGIGGVRIEHNYLITRDGCQRLTNHEIRL